MNQYYITGTSAGLGKALALQYLEEGHQVIGIARTSSIQHANYIHIVLDASDLQTVSRFEFPKPNEPEKIILINNAGTIGEIGVVGTLQSQGIEQLISLNLTAVLILCNQFIKQFQNNLAEKQIINISSGAGQSPIASWASYCASKAAVDLFSETLNKEQLAQLNPIKVFSVAPGIMDTNMQVAIRKTASIRFDRVKEFIAYKEKNELKTPAEISLMLPQIIQKLETEKRVVGSVRELSNY